MQSALLELVEPESLPRVRCPAGVAPTRQDPLVRRAWRRPQLGVQALQRLKCLYAVCMQEYGGSATHALADSEFERRLAEGVRRLNSGGA